MWAAPTAPTVAPGPSHRQQHVYCIVWQPAARVVPTLLLPPPLPPPPPPCARYTLNSSAASSPLLPQCADLSVLQAVANTSDIQKLIVGEPWGPT